METFCEKSISTICRSPTSLHQPFMPATTPRYSSFEACNSCDRAWRSLEISADPSPFLLLGLDQFSSQLLEGTLSNFPFGDVTSDSTRTDDYPCCILHRPKTHGYVDLLAGFGHTNCFIVLDMFTGPQFAVNLLLLIE